MRVSKISRLAPVALSGFLLSLATPAAAQYQLQPDLSSPRPVGTKIIWSVTGPDPDPGELVDFQLSVRRSGAAPRLLYDFSQRSSFTWAPLREGEYEITAVVRSGDGGIVETLSEPFSLVPRALVFPSVSATEHPMVALYSAPSCDPGNRMQVVFRKLLSQFVYFTNARPCVSGQTMNFWVAGMNIQSTYELRHVLLDAFGDIVSIGPPLPFTTGAPDAEVPFLSLAVTPGPETSFTESIVLAGPIRGGLGGPLAADLTGRLVWYYRPTEVPPETGDFTLMRPLPGGNIYLLGPGDDLDRLVLREVDLAGNTVRETNSRRISAKLADLGHQPITSLHHEIRLLPNGHTVVLGHVERLLEDVQGEGIVDVLGDIVIALDENLQVVWATNFFDILDVTRLATLGEVCMMDTPGCPLIYLAEEANDWTHSNSIGYSPADGNLIISVRHQEWVIKVDYRDGAGTGDLIWRLGKGGDFQLLGGEGEVDAWFSHQHDANYLGDDRIVIYDNGNANDACLADPAACVSRGQVYLLDESAMTATLEVNADLQNFAPAVGSAQNLRNGNFHFNSGFYAGAGTAQSQEVTPDGQIVFSLEVDANAYRSFRLLNLYTPPAR